MLHPCEDVLGPLEPFLAAVTESLQEMGLPVNGLEMDHVCYRCSSIKEYLDVKQRLAPFGTALEEGMIGGRPILTFLLDTPIAFQEWRIQCLEIPCPKPGRSHAHGLEHVELVICPAAADSLAFYKSRPLLEDFMKNHPDVSFDIRAIDKEVNADVSVNVRGGASVKYHARPLYEVCRYEVQHGLRVPVPHDYFSDIASAV